MRSLIFAFAGALTAVACATKPAPPPPGPLQVFGVRELVEIAPVHVASQGLYPGAAPVSQGGIPNLFTPGPAGLADVSANAETQALRVSVAHPDLRIVLTVSEGLYRIVARRSAGINALADLRGKRIAVIPDTSAAYFLHRMLKTAKLTEADVVIVPITYRSVVAPMIAAREIDAVATWEPESEKSALALGADLVEFSGEGVYREAYNLNTTAGALADPAKRASIVAYLRAIMKASTQINTDPAIGYSIVAAKSGLQPDFVARLWRHHTFPARIVPDLLDVLVEEEQWLAAKDGRQPRTRAQLATLIDDSVAREAATEPARALGR
jgi:NitT/TauT family transport system substrate-binding protein